MEEKWAGFITGLAVGIFVTMIWYPAVKNWWLAYQDKKNLPYSWKCFECRDGNAFTCRANDVAALDAMVLNHMELAHDHSS